MQQLKKLVCASYVACSGYLQNAYKAFMSKYLAIWVHSQRSDHQILLRWVIFTVLNGLNPSTLAYRDIAQNKPVWSGNF